MKKIGIFLGGTDPGSGGLFQYSLAVLESLATLPRDRYTIVAAFFNADWAAYIEPLAVRSLPLGRSGAEPFTLARIWRSACLPIGVWRRFLWRWNAVARALSSETCDLWVFPAQDHWSYLAPVRSLVTIHDLMHRYEPQFPEVSRWGRYLLREYRFKNICRSADTILVDSEVGRQQVIDCYGVSAERLVAVPYVPPRYVFDSTRPADFDQLYPLPRRFLFYPAQFWAHKNHDRLLQAIANVKADCPDVFVVLAGPKRYLYDNLVRRVAELGLREHVAFTGYLPDSHLPEFYRRARALVMPTFFGPTNIPPLEAFALGCPVVISGVYGMPEQTGDAALLIDPLSVGELTECIRKVWTDDALCDELVNKGRQRAARWGRLQFSDAVTATIQDILAAQASARNAANYRLPTDVRSESTSDNATL